MIYIIDTYAWVEYINGSNRAVALKKLFENSASKFITMECCIAELAGFCIKKKIDFKRIFELVKTNSIILPVLTGNWIEAARIKSELREKIGNFGLIDSILVSKQKELKAKIVSGDPHFKGLKDIIYIGD